MSSLAVPFGVTWDGILSSEVINLAIVLLVTLMVLKELAFSWGARWPILARYLNIAIVPLLFVLSVSVVLAVAAALQ